MPTILSTSDILNYIKNFIKSKNPDLDVQPGSDLYDLIFYGNAQTSARVYETIDEVDNLQSIFTTFGDDLDLIAKNYSLTRKGATFAQGYVTIHTVSWTQDIIIPDRTIVSTRSSVGSTGVSFRVIGDYSMIYNNKSLYFNAINGRYELRVPVVCAIAGKVGNVSAGSVSVIQSPLAQVEGVFNEDPLSGGLDSESDRDLQQRCALSWVVSSVGTKDGFKKIMLDRSEVIDAIAISPFDEDTVRNGVDVFCITNSPLESVEQKITYQNDEYTIVVKQPIVDLNSIYNNTSNYLVVEGVSYTFNKQFDSQHTNSYISDETVARIDWTNTWTGTVSGGGATSFTYKDTANNLKSIVNDAYINTRVTVDSPGPTFGQTATVTAYTYDIATDVATFTTTPLPSGSYFSGDDFTLNPRPNIGDSVSLKYAYNKDIAVLQDYANQSNVNVIGSAVLIKEGFKSNFLLTLSIKVFPGYDTATVKEKVENALSQYIEQLRLGPTIELSDLIVVAQTGRGTDYTLVEVDSVTIDTDINDDLVTYNTFIEKRNGDILTFANVVSITLENREYLVVEELTVNIE